MASSKLNELGFQSSVPGVLSWASPIPVLTNVVKAIDVKKKLYSPYTKSTHTLIKKTNNIIDGKNSTYSNTIYPKL
jgi:hypothetical protein